MANVVRTAMDSGVMAGNKIYQITKIKSKSIKTVIGITIENGGTC